MVALILQRFSRSIRYLPKMEFLTVVMEQLPKKCKTVSSCSPPAGHNCSVHIPIMAKCQFVRVDHRQFETWMVGSSNL